MGDRSSWYLTKPSRHTQSGHPSLGRRNEYWHWSQPPMGKKRRVLHNSRSYYTMGPADVGRGSYASLIGLTLAGLKRHKEDELPHNRPRCLCVKSSIGHVAEEGLCCLSVCTELNCLHCWYWICLSCTLSTIFDSSLAQWLTELTVTCMHLLSSGRQRLVREINTIKHTKQNYYL